MILFFHYENPINFLINFVTAGAMPRAHSMYGCMELFSKICKNVRNWESVHPYMTISRIFGFLKIGTWDFENRYILQGFFLSKRPFFFLFFLCFFLLIFSKFLCFAQIYNVYSMISNEFLII